MKHYFYFFIVFFPLIGLSQATSQAGNVITDYGKTYPVISPDFKTDTTTPLKVVFDVGRSFNNPQKVNSLFNTAARFLNMHEQAGVPLKNLNVALVIHGNAANDLLKDEIYNQRHCIDNPNTPLLKALKDHGVQIILCGQTAAHRKLTKDKILPQVDIALSAMTALIQLQNQDYRLINF